MKKKAIAAALACTMVLSMLMGSAARADDEPYIIMINPWISLAVFANSDIGFNDAAEELGFKGKILGCTELTDTASFEMFQQAITEQPDAIIVCPWDYSAIAPLYEEAQEKGIAVIDYSSDSGIDSGRKSLSFRSWLFCSFRSL